MAGITSPTPADPGARNDAWPPESADLLARIDHLLRDGRADQALDAATGVPGSPWVENARAVCLLRLGQPARAAEVLRGLVFDPSGLTVRTDADPAFLANYATALLLTGNTDGFHGMLNAVRDRGHPAVVRLTDAVRRWKAAMTWGEWVRSLLGAPARPLTLDFPPGDL